MILKLFPLSRTFPRGILCIGKTFSATCHARMRLTCSSGAASNVCVDFAASTFFNTVRRLAPFFIQPTATPTPGPVSPSVFSFPENYARALTSFVMSALGVGEKREAG